MSKVEEISFDLVQNVARPYGISPFLIPKYMYNAADGVVFCWVFQKQRYKQLQYSFILYIYLKKKKYMYEV